MLPLPACHCALALRELPAAAGPLAAAEALRGAGTLWLLDSALASPRLGRHSFAGADPYLVLRAHGRRVELECRRAVRPGLAPGRLGVEGDALELARALLPRLPARAGPPEIPFVGGAVAVLGYELAAALAPVSATFPADGDDAWLPDATFLFVDRLLAWDRESGRCSALGLGFGASEAEARAAASRRAGEIEARVAAGGRPAAPSPAPRVGREAPPPLDDAGFAKGVATILDEIAAGNVYQACLTHRLERPFGGDPWRLYGALRRVNPAPFACYLELPEAAIAGSSPERFLRVRSDGGVESRPIKGTRPRGRDPAEDRARRAELERSAKDRAENLMIVDLVRNDLGRVCEVGSIEVPELMAIEAYASVFQLVSTVTGRLAPGRDAFDLVRAAFPPGSMTGAPKIAAMRLLARLEPVRRGVYSGAIGYFDVRGGADLCVVIRSLVVSAGRVRAHAGGGIVADSEPRAEWSESLDKLRPLLAALDEMGGR